MKAFIILSFLLLFPISSYAGVFTRAEQKTGVPLPIIKSVAYVESGFKPFALNIDGEPYFAKSYASAYYIARYFIDKGYSVDVGLMQVNYNIWAKRLGFSLRQLLIPQNNVAAGAYILGRYMLKRNNVLNGIGEYHSSDPQAAGAYEEKILNAYKFFSR